MQTDLKDCSQCHAPLIEIDHYGERLIGCMECNRWSWRGSQKLLFELPEEDLEALRRVRKARAGRAISGPELLGPALKQLADNEGRTTAMGLFQFARAYAEAGVHLEGEKLTEGHRGAPVQFLLMHAIELYLKSFLRFHGHTVKQIWGHKFAWLAKRAEARGLSFDDGDRYVIDILVHTDALSRSRYIVTGFRTHATDEALVRTCLRLDRSVSEALKREGHTIRRKSWASDQADLRPTLTRAKHTINGRPSDAELASNGPLKSWRE